MARKVTLQLDAGGSVALNGSGNGQVPIVVPVNEDWQIDRISVSTTSQVAPTPRCDVYRNTALAQNLISGTYNGSLDTAEFPRPCTMLRGQTLLVVWTGGTAGDSASVSIDGIREMDV